MGSVKHISIYVNKKYQSSEKMLVIAIIKDKRYIMTLKQ